MHDYFEILGLSRNARPTEVRRACRRRAHATHPDICDGEPVASARRSRGAAARLAAEPYDVAIDFIDISALVPSMRDAFFRACGATRTLSPEPLNL